MITTASLLMSGCLKSLDDMEISTSTTYTGKIIDENNAPVVNRAVMIGTHELNANYVTTFSDGSGKFSLTLKYTEVLHSFDKLYLKIIKSDSRQYYYEYPLSGRGEASYDFGIIYINE